MKAFRTKIESCRQFLANHSFCWKSFDAGNVYNFLGQKCETAIVPLFFQKYIHTMGMIDAMPVYMKTKKENSLEPLNFEMTQYI